MIDGIRIDNDYVISVDNLNYTAQIDKHNFDKNGNPILKVIGYYGTLEGALEAVYEHKIATKLGDGQHSLAEAILIVKEERCAIIRKMEEVTNDKHK